VKCDQNREVSQLVPSGGAAGRPPDTLRRAAGPSMPRGNSQGGRTVSHTICNAHNSCGGHISEHAPRTATLRFPAAPSMMCITVSCWRFSPLNGGARGPGRVIAARRRRAAGVRRQFHLRCESKDRWSETCVTFTYGRKMNLVNTRVTTPEARHLASTDALHVSMIATIASSFT
jgi:hypothetical protein